MYPESTDCNNPVEKTHDRKVSLAVRIGLIANILLAGLKTAAGIFGHSPALLADGINSTSDVAYYVVVSIFIRHAYKPPDKEHPYGHRQFESIASVAVGAFVITTAITILWNAANKIFNMASGQQDMLTATPTALIVAVFTVLLKIALTFFTQEIGRSVGTSTVAALARDHRNDIFSALAAVLGISLSRLGYHWVDPLAGAVVALVILRTGIQIIQESSAELMTTAPAPILVDQIYCLLENIESVEQVEEINVQKFGHYMILNLILCMDGSMSIREGDSICTQVEQVLTENIDFLLRVHIHYHPSDNRSVNITSDLAELSFTAAHQDQSSTTSSQTTAK
ncbi:MAG: cation transporter [Anaerolineales bacterium]|nr:cation transporter [Anaerolineales bacterium]